MATDIRKNVATDIRENVFSNTIGKFNESPFKLRDVVYYKDSNKINKGEITHIDTESNTCTIDNQKKIHLQYVVPYFADREEVEIYDNDLNNWKPGTINKFIDTLIEKKAGIGYYIVIVDYKGKSVQLKIDPVLIRKKTTTVAPASLSAVESKIPAVESKIPAVESKIPAVESKIPAPGSGSSSSAPGSGSGSVGSSSAAVPLVPSGTTITFTVSSGSNYSGTIKRGYDEVKFTDLIINDDGTSDITKVTFTTTAAKTSGGSKKYYLKKTKRKRYLGKNGKSRRTTPFRN
jgi:hypothetical protein